MKNFLYISTLLLLLSSCAASRSSSTTKRAAESPGGVREPAFLENIAIKPLHAEPNFEKPENIHASKDIPGSSYSSHIERCRDLQFKYAILMDKPVEMVTNEKLVGFLEDWYGTPYRYGGDTKTGIDCSAFSSLFMESVYKISIPRTARSQYASGSKIAKSQLKQGDLVFFNTTGGISHVGVFLGNNKFVHASSSSGVMISDLSDAYFKRRYVGSARIN